MKFLSSINIRKEISEIYFQVLRDIFKEKEGDKTTHLKKIEMEVKNFNSLLESLQDKYLNAEVTKDEYQTIKKRYETKINDLRYEKTQIEEQDSTFIKQLSFGLNLLENLENCYLIAPIEVKQKIIGSIFPEKLIYSMSTYRTAAPSALLELIANNINGSMGNKKQKAIISDGLSTMAPSAGLEPATL